MQGCRIILTTTKPGIVLKHKDYENCSAHLALLCVCVLCWHPLTCTFPETRVLFFTVIVFAYYCLVLSCFFISLSWLTWAKWISLQDNKLHLIITKMKLPSMEDLYTKWFRKKVNRATRLSDSFIPQAIWLMNSWTLKLNTMHLPWVIHSQADSLTAVPTWH